MKYCKEILDKISDDLKIGLSRTDTCDDVGVHFDTFNEWMNGNLPEKILKKAKNPEQLEALKTEFSDMVKKAELESKKRCIGIIQRSAITTWQAAAWWLERKYKDEFGQNKLILGGDKNNPLVVKFSAIDEQL